MNVINKPEQAKKPIYLPQGRSTVKAILCQCGACRKYNGGAKNAEASRLAKRKKQ